MIGYRPPRPTGTTPEALFMQAVYDKLWGPESQINEVSGQRLNRTTRGTTLIKKGGAEGGTVSPCPYG